MEGEFVLEEEYRKNFTKNDGDEYDTFLHSIPQSERAGYLCKCNVCNKDVKRAIFFQNINSNEVIAAGLDCAAGIFKFKFDVAGAKKQNLAAKRKQDTLNKCAKVLDDNTGLEAALVVNHKTIREIAANFYKFGTLSEKQIKFVFSLAAQRTEFESKSTACPSGEVTDNFTVVSCKREKTAGGFTEFTYKLLVEHDSGYKLFYSGNAVSLENIIEYCSNYIGLEKGSVLKIKATVNVSSQDMFFGFMKKPKFELVSRVVDETSEFKKVLLLKMNLAKEIGVLKASKRDDAEHLAKIVSTEAEMYDAQKRLDKIYP